MDNALHFFSFILTCQKAVETEKTQKAQSKIQELQAQNIF